MPAKGWGWFKVPGPWPGITSWIQKDCQTQIKGCYCMDASVIPEAWGLPPVVTIVSLAKRLAKHLTASVETKIATPKPA